MIECNTCKHFDDSVQMKQCLAGKYQVTIAGSVMMKLGVVECDRLDVLYDPVIKIDKRSKEYRNNV